MSDERIEVSEALYLQDRRYLSACLLKRCKVFGDPDWVAIEYKEIPHLISALHSALAAWGKPEEPPVESGGKWPMNAQR